MILGRIFTIPLQDHDGDKSIGEFELQVSCNEQFFLTSGDKAGFVKNQFAHHLASASMDTKVPPEYWRGEILPLVARHCSLPQSLSFKVRP
jgi:hypothetical protein